MPGYCTPGSARRRNPYRILPSKKGRNKRERLQPGRRLMRITMAIKRFESRYHVPVPFRHWEEEDLPERVPPEVLAKRRESASDYAKTRRDRLERLLKKIQAEVRRSKKQKP